MTDGELALAILRGFISERRDGNSYLVAYESYGGRKVCSIDATIETTAEEDAFLQRLLAEAGVTSDTWRPTYHKPHGPRDS